VVKVVQVKHTQSQTVQLQFTMQVAVVEVLNQTQLQQPAELQAKAVVHLVHIDLKRLIQEYLLLIMALIIEAAAEAVALQTHHQVQLVAVKVLL